MWLRGDPHVGLTCTHHMHHLSRYTEDYDAYLLVSQLRMPPLEEEINAEAKLITKGRKKKQPVAKGLS